jgi:hypothetical protein
MLLFDKQFHVCSHGTCNFTSLSTNDKTFRSRHGRGLGERPGGGGQGIVRLIFS